MPGVGVDCTCRGADVRLCLLCRRKCRCTSLRAGVRRPRRSFGPGRHVVPDKRRREVLGAASGALGARPPELRADRQETAVAEVRAHDRERMEVRSRRSWRVVAPLDAAAASGAWLTPRPRSAPQVTAYWLAVRAVLLSCLPPLAADRRAREVNLRFDRDRYPGTVGPVGFTQRFRSALLSSPWWHLHRWHISASYPGVRPLYLQSYRLARRAKDSADDACGTRHVRRSRPAARVRVTRGKVTDG